MKQQLIGMEDPIFVEAAKAFGVLLENTELSEAAIRKALSDMLALQKVLKYFPFTENLHKQIRQNNENVP